MFCFTAYVERSVVPTSPIDQKSGNPACFVWTPAKTHHRFHVDFSIYSQWQCHNQISRPRKPVSHDSLPLSAIHPNVSKVPLFSSLLGPPVSLWPEENHMCTLNVCCTHRPSFGQSTINQTTGWSQRRHTLKDKICCWERLSTVYKTHTHTPSHTVCLVRRSCSRGVLQCNEACEWIKRYYGGFFLHALLSNAEGTVLRITSTKLEITLCENF